MIQDHTAKVVIITGSGAGMGKACAVRFAETGMNVVVADLSEAAIHSTCKIIEDQGGNAIGCQADVSSEVDCQNLADTALITWGRIDTLVANAGVQIGGSLLESTEADWEKILGVNLKGVAYSCKAVLPNMIENQSGTIVINSSINALFGSAGMAIYDMSKAGTLALMRSLAVEHGKDGIRVNAVCPGNTITDFHINNMAEKGIDVEQLREMTRGYGLLDRAAEPEEIANIMYFLASDESSFITGQAIIADGGFSVT
jgi:meso-butanediol dehydrogenase/(S,S)-butanediol dehydrogenase/diacetyl reductase